MYICLPYTTLLYSTTSSPRPLPSLHRPYLLHITRTHTLVEMRTRGGCYYGSQAMDCGKRRRKDMQCCDVVSRGGGEGGASWEDGSGGRRKRCRVGEDWEVPSTSDSGFESLPDDLVVTILSRVSSSAAFPSDFLSVFITCKRFNKLGLHPLVLSKASAKAIAVKAKNWSDSAHRFLKLCADAGNAEACYTLGMIRFYCLQSRGSGASLMARAAIASHAPALYSLSVIQFNGSGGSKTDKDLRAGVALCARAAFLGHVDALRELGHCLQDGYGVRQNIAEGRRFLVQANARELAAVLADVLAASSVPPPAWPHRHGSGACCPLLSDFGCSVPTAESHPASRFLSEWFAERSASAGPGLRLCAHGGCGRPETRRHEFRRCSVCGAVNYCSRACQALDWKARHKAECTPLEHWMEEDDDEDEDEDDDDGAGEEEMVVDEVEKVDDVEVSQQR